MKAVLVISVRVVFCDVQCVNHIVRCVKFGMNVVLINKLCFGGSNTEDNVITLNVAHDSFLKCDTKSFSKVSNLHMNVPYTCQ